jgi:C-type mannose receptor
MLGLGSNDIGWIGLKTLGGADRTFEWLDGSSEYRNWSPGEPNNREFNAYCVELTGYNGGWNDNDCGSMRKAICNV